VITEIVRISIDGAEQTDLAPDLAGVDVEEHVDSANVFALRLALDLEPDGTWTRLDEARFGVWRRLAIKAGYEGRVETLIDGYITHVDALLDEDGDAYLEVSGMDASVLMDLEDHRVAWANKKDSDIAQEIFRKHNLTSDVEDTQTRHEEKVATTLQTGSDIRFLRRLAERNGFECRVRGRTGIFRAPKLNEPPQKLLALAFGPDTNLVDLRIRVDGTATSSAEIRRVDPIAKQTDARTISRSPRRALGRDTLSGLASPPRAATTFVRGHAASSIRDLEARLRAEVEPASRFVTVEGQIDARAYRSVLRAGGLVTIKGAGARHSGLYYVSRVRHSFTADGYVPRFEAYRNALGLTGEEQFRALPAGAPIAIPFGLGGDR
jgi:phage protein D